MRPEAPPELIGRYRVLSELGRGMMGVVYRAEDPALGRTVALKVIRLVFPVTDEQRETFEQRFLAEARIVARLSHPNIVVVHDVGRDGEHGSPYMALEYLVGRTLLQVLKDGPPLDWRQSLKISSRLAEALHYAHGQGVVHRDVKPANVMLLESGEPKLMDFGLAKLHAGFELTVEGQFMGTPLYMSPEQASGEAVDGRSDLFSLGSVLYTLLTGSRAFEAESLPRILNRVIYDEPAPPTRVNKSLPVALDYVLARSLCKLPEARYPDGHSLAEDLEDVLLARPPRHRARWTRPELGELTLSSGGVSGSGQPAGPSEHAGSRSAAQHAVLGRDETAGAAPPAPRRGSRVPLGLLVLSMLSFGAVLYGSAFWRERLALALGLVPAEVAFAPAAPTPSASPDSAADGAPPPSSEPTAAALEPVAVAADLPAVTPSPSDAPSDAPAPAAGPALASSAEPALLAPASPTPSPTHPVTPTPTPEAAHSPSAPPATQPSAAPAPSPSATLSPGPKVSPKATPSAKATAKPKPTAKPTPKPKPKPKPTKKPKPKKPRN